LFAAPALLRPALLPMANTKDRSDSA